MVRIGYVLFGLFFILFFSSQYVFGFFEKIVEDVVLFLWIVFYGFFYYSKMIYLIVVWLGYGGGFDFVVIYYVRDLDENYYYFDLVMGILVKYGYLVYYWDVYYYGLYGDLIQSYYNLFCGKKIKVFYYYGYIVKILLFIEVNGFMIFQNFNFGDMVKVFWGRIMGDVDMYDVLIFVLGCDLFRFRVGVIYRIYIGIDRLIDVRLIKDKGIIFWKKFDEGKIVYQVMESI